MASENHQRRAKWLVLATLVVGGGLLGWVVWDQVLRSQYIARCLVQESSHAHRLFGPEWPLGLAGLLAAAEPSKPGAALVARVIDLKSDPLRSRRVIEVLFESPDAERRRMGWSLFGAGVGYIRDFKPFFDHYATEPDGEVRLLMSTIADLRSSPEWEAHERVDPQWAFDFVESTCGDPDPSVRVKQLRRLTFVHRTETEREARRPRVLAATVRVIEMGVTNELREALIDVNEIWHLRTGAGIALLLVDDPDPRLSSRALSNVYRAMLYWGAFEDDDPLSHSDDELRQIIHVARSRIRAELAKRKVVMGSR